MATSTAVYSPISWAVAEKVATRISGTEPFFSSYLGNSFQSDLQELTTQAEHLVEVETGLVANGPASIRVATRDLWVKANLASMDRLLRPAFERYKSNSQSQFLKRSSQAATGAQLGAALGWMSARVLGQYDLLLRETESPENQDIIYYVGPNILALEKRFAFPPREFRLWIAVHECTHRAQFTGVPWLVGYFRSQVDSLLQATDPSSLSTSVKHVASEVKAGRNPFAQDGLVSLFTAPEQRQAIERISALMSLLEGHADVTMLKTGSDLIPSADRFHRVMHARRSGARGVAKAMQRLLGFDAKLRQYAEGEHFFKTVESVRDSEMTRKVWTSPKFLPSLEEIRNPHSWIKRIEANEPQDVS